MPRSLKKAAPVSWQASDLQEGRFGHWLGNAPARRGALPLHRRTSVRGWLKWRDNRVIVSDMGSVGDNFLVKHRYALDDLEESDWETTPDGTPREPGAGPPALLIELARRTVT